MFSNSVSYFTHGFQHRYRERSKLPSSIRFTCSLEKQAATRSTAISWLILHKLFLLQIRLSSSWERTQIKSQPSGERFLRGMGKAKSYDSNIMHHKLHYLK